MSSLFDLLAGLGLAAKTGLGLATAASVVAVGGAAGVVPVLPERAERPAVQQPAGDLAQDEDEDADEVVDGDAATEQAAEGDEGEGEGEGEGGPKEGTHGATVSGLATTGTTRRELAEVASQHGAEARAAAQARRPAAPEQAGTGTERADAGAGNGAAARTAPAERPAPPAERPVDAGPPAERPAPQSGGAAPQSEDGRTTAGSAPVEDAPSGTPGEGRRP